MSAIAASALIPARKSSVFFTGRLSLSARSLSSSITAYSVLGMVTLSRTIFGFLDFDPFVKLPVSEIFNRLFVPSDLDTDFLAGEMNVDLGVTFTVPIGAADATFFRGAADLVAALMGSNLALWEIDGAATSAERIFFSVVSIMVFRSSMQLVYIVVSTASSLIKTSVA